jgi:hypothetical protein
MLVCAARAILTFILTFTPSSVQHPFHSDLRGSGQFLQTTTPSFYFTFLIHVDRTPALQVCLDLSVAAFDSSLYA